MRIKGHPLLVAIICIAAMSVGIFLGNEDFKYCYDLMQHGQFATGTVTASVQKTGSGTGKYGLGRHYTYYENTIGYAGRTGEFRSDVPMTVGQRAEIYYSSVNPGNARLREKGQPYKSLSDILLVPDILAYIGLSVFMGFFAVYSLFQWLTKSGRYYEG